MGVCRFIDANAHISTVVRGERTEGIDHQIKVKSNHSQRSINRRTTARV